MPTPVKISFCTGNPHKVAEMQAAFAQKLPGYVIEKQAIPLQELQAESLEEVAIFKLQSISQHLKPPFFIEDAGFFVDDILQGFPGVYSHYVMDTLGCQGILKLLGDSANRNAHFEAIIALRDNSNTIRTFKGINPGTVALEARGTSGFGFDPIFISADTPGKTFAEIGMEAKNRISHRSRALDKLIEFLG
ncbi:MAG: RdgB/HAM1 family non-canonical purine NTP pyrophosphatase [Promethearchaeota archaeon]|nr:MAG: RdgB/HAM1 family non-canonical purine NTP pyrophosphatase [Candidatus Lokiarchaeota archaeon]